MRNVNAINLRAFNGASHSMRVTSGHVKSCKGHSNHVTIRSGQGNPALGGYATGALSDLYRVQNMGAGLTQRLRRGQQNSASVRIGNNGGLALNAQQSSIGRAGGISNSASVQIGNGGLSVNASQFSGGGASSSNSASVQIGNNGISVNASSMGLCSRGQSFLRAFMMSQG